MSHCHEFIFETHSCDFESVMWHFIFYQGVLFDRKWKEGIRKIYCLR